MATLGGQVTAFNNIKRAQQAFAAGLGGSGTNLTELDNFWGRIASVTLRASASLNDCSWDYISKVSQAGYADAIWSVGDRKGVTLSGTVGKDTTLSETYYCYILGFNHNSAKEGNNLIHFEFGFSALSGGAHIAFVDSSYDTLQGGDTSTNTFLRMNKTRTNSGGWSASTMRNYTLNGGTKSFYAAFPADLKAVLQTVTKYTDNVGNGSGSVESNVTATTDKLFIVSCFELRGQTSSGNSNEASYQQQYQYYKNGNEKIRKKHNETGTGSKFYTRSPVVSNGAQFLGLNVTDGGLTLYAEACEGISPCFCV